MWACVLADYNSTIYELCSWEADPSSLKAWVHSGRSLCAAGFRGKPHIRTKNAIPVTARDHLSMDMRGWRGRRMAEYIFEASRDAGRARDQRGFHAEQLGDRCELAFFDDTYHGYSSG